MKYLEFASIVCFLLAGTANSECVGEAFLLVVLSAVCISLSTMLPDPKRRHNSTNKLKRKNRKEV